MLLTDITTYILLYLFKLPVFSHTKSKPLQIRSISEIFICSSIHALFPIAAVQIHQVNIVMDGIEICCSGNWKAKKSPSTTVIYNIPKFPLKPLKEYNKR